MAEPTAIALFGAPGAGKSEVALALKEALAEIANFAIIDDYAQRVADEFDMAVGVVGDHNVNLWIYYERQRLERRYRLAGQSFISCGSPLENIVHGGLYVEDIGRGIQTSASDAKMMREMHATTVLSCLMVDRMKFDVGAYLPLQKVSLSDGGWNERVDAGLRDVIDKFNIGLDPCRGTVDQQVEKIAKAVAEHANSAAISN